jgi:probable biosynthetic protein (TIGR04098 family)
MEAEAIKDDLVVELGMPLLGRNGLNESSLLKWIGNDRWQELSQLGGIPSSRIRDDFDNRLYATFCFVEMKLSPDRPLSSYGENDLLRFVRSPLQHYERVYLDGRYELATAPFAIRCTNVFIYQLAGPQQLKMAQPENLSFDRMIELSTQPDSLDLCRAARTAGTFQTFSSNEIDMGARQVSYVLDADRDANGAGLIYFANFVCFLDYAERSLLQSAHLPTHLIDARSTYWRRIGYFGNAQVDDELEISITGKASTSQEGYLLLAFDYRVNRRSDGKMILVSSARKSSKMDEQAAAWIHNLNNGQSK